jgi:catechol 2,3-dioxygenase
LARAPKSGGLDPHGWTDQDYAHGRAYKFCTPDGHRQKVLWNLDYFKAAPDLASKLRNRPSKRPLRGVPVRRIDHVNLMVSDVVKNTDFMINVLDFRNARARSATAARLSAG